MNVVIKDFDVPYCCELCNLSTYTDRKCDVLYCYATGHEIEQPTNKRDSNCPLIELPKQHGRLIDADELIKKLRNYHPTITFGDHTIALRAVVEDCEEIIKQLPTVIEAEDGE